MVAIAQIADALLRELAASFPARRVLGAWLYGSHARGEARAKSDFDIGVLCDAPLDPVVVFDASGRLAAELGSAVDLVDLQRAGGLLRIEATHGGRALVPPTVEAELFKTHALADYAAFAPNRKAATRAFEEKYRAR